MKELGRIVGYSILAAVANVVAAWAGHRVSKETSKTTETES